eukprot:7429224-Lingulodinium_polyedra.AAC.1
MLLRSAFGTHATAAAPRIFAKRALHANTPKWCSHGARVSEKRKAPQRWNAFRNALLSSCRAKADQKRVRERI